MTRRFLRLGVKLSAAVLAFFLLVVLLDNRYEVLPDSIHSHLPLHHPGFVIIDITIRECNSINPFWSCNLDPQLWERIDKDLYLDKSYTSSAYLHMRRKKEEEISEGDKVVLDIRVGRLDPSKEPGAKPDEIWESRPGGIWIQRSARRREVDSRQAITAVDVLFGSDAVEPRIGWKLTGTHLLIDHGVSGLEPRITFRSGAHQQPEKPVLKIRPNGRFKIMQAADLHLSTGVGACRDPQPPSSAANCEADTRTLEFIGKLLDQEEPDLVILSGDQVNGETSPDVQTAIFKFADLFVHRKIPYAAIFGNHDDESHLSRSTTMHLLESLPYSLSTHGPTTVPGVGNYVLEVQAPGQSHHSALSLYLLDTHSYSPDERHYAGYNWIKEDQIKWFRATSRTLKEKHRKYAKIHMDMAFIHIPLPEYRHEKNKRVGEWREAITAPYFNSGFKDALVDEGIMIVSCGHDHANDFCSLERSDSGAFSATDLESKNPSLAPEPHLGGPLGKPELWMCYGGGSGFGGYGGYNGYHRRVRFYEVDANGASIVTYKRLEYGETKEKRLDEQVVVSEGRVVDR